MLARARASTNDAAIEYRRLAIEDIDFSAGEFDVVLSSLALHYVERFDLVCRNVHYCLVPGGSFVFSVEHPVFTALAAQEWYYGQHGSDYIGLSISIKRKARVGQDFWIMR
jgi:2-polyprenyl-3-methyl-5-hydroxy-6-metoxy-1,4-benzoquinol methylase